MLLNCGVGEDSWESLGLQGDQTSQRIFIGRTNVEAETPTLWPPDAKKWLIGKDPDAGKDWMQEEKGTTEDDLVGWHHRLDGHEFEQASGVGEGQGSLVCCSLWGRRVRHDWATELTDWCKELTHWKRPWCWERLKAGGEGDNRGWDGSMASPAWWTWVWAISESWWWTGRLGVLWSMLSQRVGHDWGTELNWTEYSHWFFCFPFS